MNTEEVLHTRMDYTVLDYMLKDSDWQNALSESKDEIKQILDDVTQQELDWSEYLFSEGRQVVGLNEVLLKEYVQFMAKPIYDFLGVEYKFEDIAENPLPYMEKYVDPSQMQSAAQEINITSYKVGSIKDDTTDLDLDFDL